MFPFARRILADAVRDGGFPPLLLDPIDFAGLYASSCRRRAPTSRHRSATHDRAAAVSRR